MSQPRPHMEGTSRSHLPEVAGVVICVLALSAVAHDQWLELRRCRNCERDAIGAMKTIATAQSLFREDDYDGDDDLDYGTLPELSQANLIDSVLGDGTKAGYLFECSYGASTSEFIWFATARPTLPGVTGDRYFATNHEGVTFYTYTGAFSLNTVSCTIPAGAVEMGR